MQRIKKKLCAAGASLLLAVTAAGAVPFSADAAVVPSLTMSLLAGGSQIGLKFTVTPYDGFTLVVNNSPYELQEESFILPVNPAEMTEKITVSVKEGDSVIVEEKSVSVSSYLQEQLSNDTYGDVAQAMLNYGFSADQYFNGNAKPADYGLTAAPDYSSVSIAAEPFSDADNFNNYYMNYYGMNLTLLDEIQFSIFFEATPAELQYYDYDIDRIIDLFFSDEHTGLCTVFGGDTVPAVARSGKYAQISRRISAAKLDEPIGFSVGSTSGYSVGSANLTFKPTQYLAAAVQSSTASNELKDLCKAIYAYGNAAASVPNAGCYSGRLTWYNYSAGCTSMDDYVATHHGDSELHAPVAALTDELYNRYAGAWIEINYNGNKMNAVVADAMPYATNQDRVMGDVDLDKDSFEKLTGGTGGDLPITWKIIENPYADEENITLKLKSYTSQWYMELQVQNSRYPIQHVTVERRYSFMKQLNEGGLFYGFFGMVGYGNGALIGEEGLGDGNCNYEVMLTDIYGNTVSSTFHIDLDGKMLTEDTLIPLDVQFPS